MKDVVTISTALSYKEESERQNCKPHHRESL